jgi:6-phosphogluconolactonase
MAQTLLLSGSYSEGTPAGINLLSFDDATGTLALVHALPGAPDASFFAYDEGTRRLYTTDEMKPALGAFSLASGAAGLTPLGYRPASAKYPCYVALSPDRRHVAVACYGSDVVEVYATEANGALRAVPQVLRGTGSTAEGHGHWVQWSPEGDRLYVVDLGHDEVRTHAWDAGSGKAGPATTAFRMKEKSGPRHLAFHPGGKHAYLFTEYSNTITALGRNADGTLAEIETKPTIPAGFTGTSYGAHIQLSADGRRVYVSNRGHNSIAAFAIGGDGRLSALGTVSCGGDWPRFFLLLEKHLISANQKSGNLAVFDVAADGTLRPNGKGLDLPAPVMLLPIKG